MSSMNDVLSVLARNHHGTPAEIESLKQAGAFCLPGLYEASVCCGDNQLFAVIRTPTGKRLAIAAGSVALPDDFDGDKVEHDGCSFLLCPWTAANSAALRRRFPWSAPRSLADRPTTIGCGDRLGRATGGHLRAIRHRRIAPILAQQSIRELTLTHRTFQDVVDDVTFLVFQSGYRDGYGADGDHLKTLDDIRAAVECGMTMITLDVSEVMRAQVADFNDVEIEDQYNRLPDDLRTVMRDAYIGKTFALEGRAGRGSVTLSEREAKICAVMYTPALDFTRTVYELLVSLRGEGQFDLEMSIDETSTPTLPEHHLFIIRELVRRGVRVVSLAPRFIGEFQKGIDYIGDLSAFREQFRDHALIAQAHGDYKISVHSGSDKFSIFPIVAELTGGRFHEKTAGTSWLEAVRLVALRDPDLYRQFHAVALQRLPDALKLYHITPDLDAIPDLSTVSDDALPDLMNDVNVRRVLHVAYGYILDVTDLRTRFYKLLDACEDDHEQLIAAHFERHLDALQVPCKD